MIKIYMALALIILYAGCSIIEDSDITDPNADLKLSALTIIQTTQDGTRDLGDATSTFDSQGRIASVTWNISNSDFAFRTGDRTSANSSYQVIYSSDQNGIIKTNFESYDSQGRITRITNTLGGVVFEVYEFEYDSQGRLLRLTTTYGDDNNSCFTSTPPACVGLVYTIRDSIEYAGSKIDYIKRAYYDGTNELFQEAIYAGYGSFSQFSSTLTNDDIGVMAIARFSPMTGVPNPDLSIFDQQSSPARTVYLNQGYQHWSLSNNQFTAGYANIRFNPLVKGKVVPLIELKEVRFTDTREFVGDEQNRLPDIYYFHPFLIFPSLFENGTDLAGLYFNDWWIRNPILDPGFTFRENRNMKLNFNYTK